MNQSIARNFFCIGAMDHVYALSYAASMGFTSGRIFCIDGEGSFVMHAGNTALLAGASPPNIIHIVIYDGVYASTGNHTVTIRRENMASLARGFPRAEVLCRRCERSRKGMPGLQSTLIIVTVYSSTQSNLQATSQNPHE